MPLQVGIIGAGIGGLSAAIALRRAGAEVEVFEKSQFKNEVGGAITITPNGGRILHDWGLDSARANVTMMHQQSIHNATTMTQVWSTELTDVEKNYGTPFEVYHRVDLHQELRRLAQDEHLPGKPSRIILGKLAVDLDCSNGIVEFEDGSKIQKDLVIVAAGVKTNFPSTITGKPEPVKNLGWSTYRGLIPMDRILGDDVTRKIWEGREPGYWVIVDHVKLLFTICYECRGGTLLNIAMRTTTQPEDENKLDWNDDAKLEDVLDKSKEYHPALAKLWEKVLAVKMFNNLRRDPLDKYTRGRAVIIGDAAHTVAPQHAQGANLAIEEAAALELLFKGVETVEPVNSRLALYEKILKKHVHIVQLLSDSFPTKRDTFRIQAEELWGPGLPPVEAAGFSPPYQKFFYGYDVRAEVKKAMGENGL